MNSFIGPLQKGDLIAIVAPAKAIDHKCVEFAKSFFENAGFKVIIGKNTLGQFNYFSGTDLARASDFQDALDNPDVKAIICARGGYGVIRILDSIQWAAQLRSPKWIVGFSDVTVFHQRMQRFGIQSIHGTMPLNFESNSPKSLSSLISALTRTKNNVRCLPNNRNKQGKASGKLIGGNLSILYSLLGTDDQLDYSNCILFIEDVGEQFYAIDRMLHSFKKSGILGKISGLIVGGMTHLKDTENPTGFDIETLILDQFKYSKTPICFNFPAGHQDDNRALILGSDVQLFITSSFVELSYVD